VPSNPRKRAKKESATINCSTNVVPELRIVAFIGHLCSPVSCNQSLQRPDCRYASVHSGECLAAMGWKSFFRIDINKRQLDSNNQQDNRIEINFHI
jgi:hypothetical protein